MEFIGGTNWKLECEKLNLTLLIPKKIYKSNKSLEMSTERTFIMIKPDGVQRGIVGQIIQRFE